MTGFESRFGRRTVGPHRNETVLNAIPGLYQFMCAYLHPEHPYQYFDSIFTILGLLWVRSVPLSLAKGM